MLADGSYEALVVDAVELDGGGLSLDVTVLAGDHKGEVVTIVAHGLGREAIDLLAVPAMLVVADSQPTVHLED